MMKLIDKLAIANRVDETPPPRSKMKPFEQNILTDDELDQIDQSVDLIFNEMKKNNADMLKIMNVLKSANDALEFNEYQSTDNERDFYE